MLNFNRIIGNNLGIFETYSILEICSLDTKVYVYLFFIVILISITRVTSTEPSIKFLQVFRKKYVIVNSAYRLFFAPLHAQWIFLQTLLKGLRLVTFFYYIPDRIKVS
jgi:hypothetical protein